MMPDKRRARPGSSPQLAPRVHRPSTSSASSGSSTNSTTPPKRLVSRYHPPPASSAYYNSPTSRTSRSSSLSSQTSNASWKTVASSVSGSTSVSWVTADSGSTNDSSCHEDHGTQPIKGVKFILLKGYSALFNKCPGEKVQECCPHLNQQNKQQQQKFKKHRKPEHNMVNHQFCDVVKQGQVKIKSRNLGLWQRRWIVLRRASSMGPCRLDKYLDRTLYLSRSKSDGYQLLSGLQQSPPSLQQLSSTLTPKKVNPDTNDKPNGVTNNKQSNGVTNNKQSNGVTNNNKVNGVTNNKANGTPKSTLELRDVTSIARVPSETCPSAFTIEFANGNNRLVCCENDADADDWVAVLSRQCLCPSPTGLRKNRAFQSIPPQYDEVFNVYLLPSKKTVISGEVILQVAPDRIYLWDVDAPTLKLLEWPLNSFKRYGRDNSKFSFEVGSNCFTGEGTFIFRTKAGDSIYKLFKGKLGATKIYQANDTSDVTFDEITKFVQAK